MEAREFHAAQAFLLGAKTFWTTSMYRALRQELSGAGGDGAPSLSDVAEVLEPSPLYQYFAWLERHLQRMKYSGRYGLVPYHDERRADFAAELAKARRSVETPADFQLPNYYTSVDIHQHPGGVWSDEMAGMVYERGARTTTPLLGAAHEDLHGRFTNLIANDGAPGRILDMGCGFGKSSVPLARKFDNARIESIDLSLPCLSLGVKLAEASAADNIRFRQADARRTDYSDEAFDLVTSTMLLHELPPKGIQSLLAEAFRVLEPGGRMVHLDFYDIPDMFRRFLHYGHGRRNNEPFMEPLARLDLKAMLEEIGFSDVRILPFKESEDVDLTRDDAWRFPWTVISAAKPQRS